MPNPCSSGFNNGYDVLNCLISGAYKYIPSLRNTMSSKQRLVLSIIDFLNQSVEDGTVKQDDKESLEVASASLSGSL